MKNKNLVILIGSIIVLALITTFFIYAFQKDDKNKKDTNSDNLSSSEVISTESTVEDLQAIIESEKTENEYIEEVKLPNLKTSEYETKKITLGIDVSEHQGNIDWKKVSKSGIDFAMVRVGYRGSTNGKIKEDATARYNLQEATKNGLKVGAYFFSTAINENEAKEEAIWTANLIKSYGITYPVAFNCEGFTNEHSRQYHLTKAERTNFAKRFLATIEEQGYTGMFYAAMSELENNLLWNINEIELKYRIWVAQYSSVTWPQKEKSDYTRNHVMWQYTNNGKIDGIKGNVDFNVAYFGYSQSLEAKDNSNVENVEANIEIGVKFEEVNQKVTAKDEVNLRSSMSQANANNIVCKLKNGEIATRTGIGNNGWSRISYQGKTLYCVSSFVTTDTNYKKPVEELNEFKTKFNNANETVTPKIEINLRNKPSVTDSEIIATIKSGETFKRIGISTDGGYWSKVEYNGQILYCVSSYLVVK